MAPPPPAGNSAAAIASHSRSGCSPPLGGSFQRPNAFFYAVQAYTIAIGRDSGFLSRMPPRVVGGFLTPPCGPPQQTLSPGRKFCVLAWAANPVRKQDRQRQQIFGTDAGICSRTASLPGAQIAAVPLPLRKPEMVYKVPDGKGAKANPTTKKNSSAKKMRGRSRRAKSPYHLASRFSQNLARLLAKLLSPARQEAQPYAVLSSVLMARDTR